jgi:hypothetical protein
MSGATPEGSLLSVSDPRWREFLNDIEHDFYHLPEYQEFGAAHQEAGEPVAFLAEEARDRLLVPMIIRPIPDEIVGHQDRLDAISLRGYPGPLLSVADPDRSEDFVDRASISLKRTLAAHGVVSAYIRLHPLFELPLAALRRHGAVVDHGDAVVVDLTTPYDEMWRMTEHGHRRHINRIRKDADWTVRIDEKWERLDGLVQAYDESMARLGAASHWRLRYEYFDDMHAALGDRISLCVAEYGDRLAAAALLTEEAGIAEYYLSGTVDDFVRASPSKAIIDFARQWAKERGNRVLNLAGSLRRGDSLSKFKLGFSPLHYPVMSWRLVSDEPAYDALTAAWSQWSRSTPDDPDGFFPAYRQDPSRS